MFDEPIEQPGERAIDPKDRARDKADEFRMHAELAAVFEGCRKFDARINARLDPEIALEVQRTIARLEKARSVEHPVLPPEFAEAAAGMLTLAETRQLTTNDYHIHRRPGEVIIIRWLAGEQVETFYERLQAHFDVAMTACREEERQSLGWKQDPQTLAYLDALDTLEVKMSERYLRPVIRDPSVLLKLDPKQTVKPKDVFPIFVLSTQTADEMDVLHLCDYVMGVEPAEVVGRASAPPEAPTEQDRAWFFKLFSLRGMVGGVERMCFFTFMQKVEDPGW